MPASGSVIEQAAPAVFKLAQDCVQWQALLLIKLKHWILATRQWVCQNITSLTLAGLMSLPLNTSAVTLVSITAETPCNNRNVGNAEKSTWPSYRNLRSFGSVTVLPTAIASSTLLACHVGTHTHMHSCTKLLTPQCIQDQVTRAVMKLRHYTSLQRKQEHETTAIKQVCDKHSQVGTS